MSTLSYRQLTEACRSGGGSTLSVRTELTPAGGTHAAVTPSIRPGRGASVPEIRLIDGQPTATMLIDDSHDQLRRVAAAIGRAIGDGHPLLSRLPRMEVGYEGGRLVYTDLELPQRIFDGHFLTGAIDGRPAITHPGYRAARRSTPDNARAVMELSPSSLVFGATDAAVGTGRSHFRGVLSGEIIGVLVDGASTDFRTVTQVGVCCSRIIRTQVLSFAALRELRFDCGQVGDEAVRVLLAAYALAGLTRSNAELSIRANCDLVETGPTGLTLDARDGDFLSLAAPSIADVDALLEQALAQAYREADISWAGQVLHVTGNAAAYEAAHNGGGLPTVAAGLSSRRLRLPRLMDSRFSSAN